MLNNQTASKLRSMKLSAIVTRMVGHLQNVHLNTIIPIAVKVLLPEVGIFDCGNLDIQKLIMT